jgi:uncharacterized protein YciI
MFLICFKPIVAPEQLKAIYPAHLAWAARGFEAGVFLAGGRRIPPTGGMIFARHDQEAVERLIAEEPFCREHLAEIELQELDIMTTASGLERLKDG